MDSVNYNSVDMFTWIIYDDLESGILYEIVTEYNDSKSYVYSICINKKNIYNDDVESILIPINLILDNKAFNRKLNAISRMIREENIFALKNDVQTLKRILV